MQYPLTPYSCKTEPFVWWDNAFTEQELNWLQEKAKASEQDAFVGKGNKGVLDNNIRRSQISWLKNNPNTKWVFERLSEIVSQLNADYYRFDLTGFGEPFQLTHYDQSENGMYGWHQDYGSKISRKLSMAIQLSDPSDYEGGNLEIMTSSQPIAVQKRRGLIAVFPSYVLHQVTPVTQGSRQSLVAWVSGAPFK